MKGEFQSLVTFWAVFLLVFTKIASLTTNYLILLVWKWRNSGLWIFICQICKLNFLFWTCPKLWAIFIFKVSYLYLLLSIFYHSFLAIALNIIFLVLFGEWKLLFCNEKNIQDLISMVFYSKKTAKLVL